MFCLFPSVFKAAAFYVDRAKTRVSGEWSGVNVDAPCALERLRDKVPVVRAQSARALSRLQDGGESNDFSEDAITAAFVQLLGRGGTRRLLS